MLTEQEIHKRMEAATAEARKILDAIEHEMRQESPDLALLKTLTHNFMHSSDNLLEWVNQ